MKYWLFAAILAFVLSIGGIGESQTTSQFPKLNVQDVISVEFGNCNDVVFSVVGYIKDNDLKYYVYEVSDTVFAVIEFGIDPDQAVAIYILRPDKSVLKFAPAEFDKLDGPCKTIESLKLTNERNKF